MVTGNQEKKAEEVKIQATIETGYIPVTLVKSLYGLSTSFLYQLFYERKLAQYKLANRTFISKKELEDLIQRGKKEYNVAKEAA